MFGQIPERDFYYPVELTDSLELIWNEGTIGSFGTNSVVFEDDYLFVTDLAGNLFCFQADSGQTIGADKGSGESVTAPILDEGFVYYIQTIDNEVYSKLIRYDIRKGERFKEVEIPGRVGNELIKFEDGLFLVSDDGLAQYYDVYLRKIWEVELGQNVYSSPAANNSVIFIPTLNGDIIALTRKEGKELYRKELAVGFESALTLKKERGYIGDINGNIICFDINDGTKLWEKYTGAKIKACPVMNDRDLFVSNLAGTIISFNTDTGNENWVYNSEGIFNTSPALFKNILLQPDLAEKLLFINPANGELVKMWDFDDRLKLNPVYYKGILYIGKDRGEILAYKLVRDFK